MLFHLFGYMVEKLFNLSNNWNDLFATKSAKTAWLVKSAESPLTFWFADSHLILLTIATLSLRDTFFENKLKPTSSTKKYQKWGYMAFFTTSLILGSMSLYFVMSFHRKKSDQGAFVAIEASIQYFTYTRALNFTQRSNRNFSFCFHPFSSQNK